VSAAEIDRLPDPDLFRDVMFLVDHAIWTPQALDECDALVLALVRKFYNAKRG